MTQSSFLAGQRVQIGATSRPRAATQVRMVPCAALELKAPPFALDALEGKGMSKETLEYHWGAHHKAYVTNLNNQIAGKEMDGMTLEQIVLKSWNGGSPTAEFNNAAQVWNHDFFWESMSPNGGGAPSGAVAAAIDKAFGSFDEFKTQFKAAGATQFGSGWAWLVTDKAGNLKISKTPNAQLPVVNPEEIPILTMDVWEHAYYIDYRNKRPDFMTNFVDNLINWDKVAERYAAATA